MTLISNYLQIKSYKDLTYPEKAEVIIALSKAENFYLAFFNNLPYCDSKTECFNHLNDLHYEIYQTYMYSDYNSFSRSYCKYIRKRRKK